MSCLCTHLWIVYPAADLIPCDLEALPLRELRGAAELAGGRGILALKVVCFDHPRPPLSLGALPLIVVEDLFAPTHSVQ